MGDQGREGFLSPWLRMRRIRAALPFIHGRTLDVGCGSGELARYIESGHYVGVDLDSESISIARSHFPNHRFSSEIPEDASFDTIVLLAVVEHVASPDIFLRSLLPRLDPRGGSTVVITTPSPQFEWVHTLGAKLGVFSREASREHQRLLRRSDLEQLGLGSIELAKYQRFLGGANQLAIYHTRQGAVGRARH